MCRGNQQVKVTKVEPEEKNEIPAKTTTMDGDRE